MSRRELIIPGRPVPEGRARLSARGGFARAYTPAATRKAKEWLAREVYSAWVKHRPIMEGPVRLEIKTWSVQSGARVKDMDDEVLRDVKPDLDNLEKLIMDAITQAGCVWHDDAQVAVKVSEKRICRPGRERTWIAVQRAEEHEHGA